MNIVFLDEKIFLKKFIKSVDSGRDMGIIYQVFEREIHDVNGIKWEELVIVSFSFEDVFL